MHLSYKQIIIFSVLVTTLMVNFFIYTYGESPLAVSKII